MGFKEDFYPECRFGGFTDIDGTIIFYTRVKALLDASSVVLDLGCGRGAYGEASDPTTARARVLKGHCQRVIGVDVDAGARENPFLDDFHLIEGTDLPLPDDSIDLCVCVDVLEHVEDPDALFSELQRVLKDGGHLCIRTTNSWSYVALISRLVPNRHHARVLAFVERNGRKPQDIFPTRYRCNNLFRLRSALTRYGFDHVVKGYEAEPSYLSFSRFAYFLGVLHQRFAPGFLRVALFAFARLRKTP